MAGWLRDEGLSPWLQPPPKNCNALAVHQVWCGEGELLPMRPARQSFVITYVGPDRSHIRFWPGGRLLTVSPSSLSSSSLGVMLCSSLLLVSLCLECYSIWLKNVIPFDTLTIFQMLDLIVNYPLPLLTFISTMYRPPATKNRIQYYPRVHSALSRIKISLPVISGPPSSHA